MVNGSTTTYPTPFIRGRNGREKVELIKVNTTDMESDIGTKSLTRERIHKLMKLIGYVEVSNDVLKVKHAKAKLLEDCLTHTDELVVSGIQLREGRKQRNRHFRNGGRFEEVDSQRVEDGNRSVGE